MDPIYVTGHRNPDTDSIVAAISYAALRNACGDREYEAACLGRVSDETQIVLDRFGFLPPKRITDLYNQVRDLDFDKPPILSGGVTMGRAWDEFQAYPAIASIPVVNEDGTLYGILSRTDIADYNMSRTNSGVLEEVPLFNAISVLEGKILNDAGESTDTISGEVTIALPQSRENLLFHSRESIVLCGNQPDMIRRALELNVSCLVLCQAEIPEELRTMPTETCIISTPYDAFRAARLIFQSIPVERICNTQNVVSFHLDDRVDTVRDMVLKYRHPSYPILDGSEKMSTTTGTKVTNAYQEKDKLDVYYWFGSDTYGRDIWTRTWEGARVSLIIAVAAAIIDMVIGMSYGLISGYFGGKVDMLMQRFLEVANGIPRLVIVTLLLLVLQPGMITIIFALMLTEWVGMSRIARAEMLKLKDQEFVLASRTLGAGSFFIIFKEVLPNIIGPIITQVMFSIPTAIFTEAFLSFVGLGIPVPQCSLGSLISELYNSFTTHPYQIIPPIVVMSLLMMSFNLVADGLREALDPKMKSM